MNRSISSKIFTTSEDVEQDYSKFALYSEKIVFYW